MISTLFVKHIPGFELSDLFVTYEPGLEVSDLFVGVWQSLKSVVFL